MNLCSFSKTCRVSSSVSGRILRAGREAQVSAGGSLEKWQSRRGGEKMCYSAACKQILHLQPAREEGEAALVSKSPAMLNSQTGQWGPVPPPAPLVGRSIFTSHCYFQPTCCLLEGPAVNEAMTATFSGYPGRGEMDQWAGLYDYAPVCARKK